MSGVVGGDEGAGERDDRMEVEAPAAVARSQFSANLLQLYYGACRCPARLLGSDRRDQTACSRSTTCSRGCPMVQVSLLVRAAPNAGL